MRILFVHSGNAVGGESAKYTFVLEQGMALCALRNERVDVEYFAIVGKGTRGYMRNVKPLRGKIQEWQPDIVHAHYGLCGMVALLAARNRVPIVITCHNGETFTKYSNIISSLAIRCANYTICVAQHIYDKLYFHPRHYTILPCGIDLENLPIVPKAKAQKEMNLPKDKVNILFGGAFANARKNAPLAREAIALLEGEQSKVESEKSKDENTPKHSTLHLQPSTINLIEMKGYNRHQVAMLLCGCDMLLLPTKSEGSPQVVKEAMACNCPVVATDVADIAHLLHGVKNSYVTTFDPADIADKIRRVIDSGERSNGRERIEILHLDNSQVAHKLLTIYRQILGSDGIGF